MADEDPKSYCCKPFRLAEKRRSATCQFADRVAQVSVDQFHLLPEEDRPQKTCVATIVAHHDGDLRVLSMGIGTKFVSESTLQEEVDSENYGIRVRDSPNNSIKYTLKPGVTLHMYTSSAPCGNATLKKFAKMTREKFIDMDADNWPEPKHEPINGHAIREGQFALLVKKDPFAQVHTEPEKDDEANPTKKRKVWPANASDDWTPPGTTIVQTGKGSIHCCSDKICLWNCLGIQGSLLASFLEKPLHINTLTVGRKLTQCICRRAVCCRLSRLPALPSEELEKAYSINHPSIMGTGVYLDEAGIIEVDNENRGQDVRFHSSKCWAWWSSIYDEEKGATDNLCPFECINGATGFLFTPNESSVSKPLVSRLSTSSLVSSFLNARSIACGKGELEKKQSLKLYELLALKKELSPQHESVKEEIFTKHRILRQWKRRGQIQKK
ncbi:unnamed protein product [Cylindrotheca closterium]|uniref:A to I editase domain-containing protein n=1 Tax=Cylindrotheca closterium TaxID=2856 RepID=A0AAD2FUA6_9STRA|nr:unnamed protein product [Cylindrotheca closterium]